jgi:hypothetical protein
MTPSPERKPSSESKPSKERLAALAYGLVDVIGVSDRFTTQAAHELTSGLDGLQAGDFSLELQAGLGEALLVAFYKALALFKPGQANLNLVTDLYLRHRFLCSVYDLVDRRALAFQLRHGLDREIQESASLHATARLAETRRAEALSFGTVLAGYFGIAPASPDKPETRLELKPWFGHLWTFEPQGGGPGPLGHLYLLAPRKHLGIACETSLCQMVARFLPFLGGISPAENSLLCAPLGTRKLSLSKPGHLSSSTYFDGAKPVAFSLNRAIEPYLLLSQTRLEGPAELATKSLHFAPVLDSLSSLVYRDPDDYKLGDTAFQHQPLQLPSTAPITGQGRKAGLLNPTTVTSALVEGLLIQAELSAIELSPCHHLCDRYARIYGYSGHGPSGVMNQSVLLTSQGQLSTWRYERNFDSWSGRSADVARHPSLNFLAIQDMGPGPLRLQPLTYGGFPSECKVEDLRLFAHQGEIYATAALILSRSRYRDWLPDISAEAAANNTIDDMLVVQAWGQIDLQRCTFAFKGLPLLEPMGGAGQVSPSIPTAFEKNWLIHPRGDEAWLFYSVQPWRVFKATSSLGHWRLQGERSLALPPGMKGPLRNSAPPFPIPEQGGIRRLGLVVHQRRSGTYVYDQYLIVLDAETLDPSLISRAPILSVNAAGLANDAGFRKNDGVCYVSSALVVDQELRLFFNLFDCRTCVISLAMPELIAKLDDGQAFAQVDLT